MEKAINFLKGVGMIMEIKPRHGYSVVSRSRSDAENIASDWRKVGRDLRVAIRKANAEPRSTQRKAS